MYKDFELKWKPQSDKSYLSFLNEMDEQVGVISVNPSKEIKEAKPQFAGRNFSLGDMSTKDIIKKYGDDAAVLPMIVLDKDKKINILDVITEFLNSFAWIRFEYKDKNFHCIIDPAGKVALAMEGETGKKRDGLDYTYERVEAKLAPAAKVDRNASIIMKLIKDYYDDPPMTAKEGFFAKIKRQMS